MKEQKTKKRKALGKLLLPVLMMGVLSTGSCFIGVSLDIDPEGTRNSNRFTAIIKYCFSNHACKHAEEACEKNPAHVRHGKCILNTVTQTFSPRNPALFRGYKNLNEAGKISYFRLEVIGFGRDGVVFGNTCWWRHLENNNSYIREIYVGNNSAFLRFTKTQQEQPTLFGFITTRLNGVDIVFYREC